MFYIILNPVSQSGRGIRIWNEIKPIFTKQEIPYKLFCSRHPGHTGQLVQKIAERLPQGSAPANIILLGGDGTLNEAIQGVTDFSKLNFGYIPTGSSNDFARDLKLSKNPREILNRILENCEKDRIRLLDLGELHDRRDHTTTYFIVSSGIGFDAAVCEESATSPIKKMLNRFGLGKLTYLGIALKQLVKTRPVPCKLTLDDQKTIKLRKFLFVSPMLHQYEGGGFKFAPDADATDGVMDICVFGDIPKLLILFAFPTAFFGVHRIFRGVDSYRAKKLEIQTSVPLWIHTDGEVSKKSDHIVLTCRREAIRMLV